MATGLCAAVVLLSPLAAPSAEAATTDRTGQWMTGNKDKVRVGTNGKFFIYNNKWGLPGEFQKVRKLNNKGGWEMKTVNRAPDVGSRLNYPSIVMGWSYSNFNGAHGLPTKLGANKNVKTYANYYIGGNPNFKYNVSYDLWIHNENQVEGGLRAGDKPAAEVMVWLRYGRRNSPGYPLPIGRRIASKDVTIDGVDWEFWQNNKWQNEKPFPTYTFRVKKGYVNKKPLNMKNFLNYLRSKGLLQGNQYLSSISFGAEVWRGFDNRMKVHEYRVDITN